MMTELLLTWLGTVALLATLGLFYQFRDRWTALLVEFAATALWGLFALSAMTVVVPSGATEPATASMDPLVYLGLGFALITFLYAIYDLLVGLGQEAQEIDASNFGRS